MPRRTSSRKSTTKKSTTKKYGMQIHMFSSKTLPAAYQEAIMEGNFCRRGNSFISPEWIEFQLSHAPVILVAVFDGNVGAFLIGFKHGKEGVGGGDVPKHAWHLDTICRSPHSIWKPSVPLLMNRFIKEARRQAGIKTVRLYATTRDSADVYVRYGFEPVGRIKRGGTEMILTL